MTVRKTQTALGGSKRAECSFSPTLPWGEFQLLNFCVLLPSPEAFCPEFQGLPAFSFLVSVLIKAQQGTPLLVQWLKGAWLSQRRGPRFPGSPSRELDPIRCN